MLWTGLFPEQVVVISATEEMWRTPLLPEEEALICRAMAKRQREFRAGRHCAHAALSKFGLPQTPILRDERRAPVWPTGFVGSISHCRDYCLAACCSLGRIRGLGVDVEPLAPLKPGLDTYIHSMRESNFLRAYPEIPERLIFSAKESLYKCFYPFVKRHFGFHAVELLIDPRTQCFTFIQTGETRLELPLDLIFTGRYLTSHSHLFTASYLTRP
jgi:4'-phosphopantetheinyl transferase EntD